MGCVLSLVGGWVGGFLPLYLVLASCEEEAGGLFEIEGTVLERGEEGRWDGVVEELLVDVGGWVGGWVVESS